MSGAAAGTLTAPQENAFGGVGEKEEAAKKETGGHPEQESRKLKFSLMEQIERDKDDGSVRTLKDQLPGRLDVSASGIGGKTIASKEPELKILSLCIQSPGRPDLNLPLLLADLNNSKRTLFTLKEGSRYRTKFSFTVLNSFVSGLKYTFTVWKAGIRVDNTKIAIGSFSPRQEPYTHELPEQTIPCGLFARGSYFVRTRFVDNDGRCYMEFSYYFEIRKNWQ